MKILPNRIHQGHVLDVLRQWDPEQIDICFTSPPYYGLRNYKTNPQIWGGDLQCDHEWIKGIKEGIDGGKNSAKLQARKDVVNFQIVEDTEYQYCAKCNAWKGELGQEPTPDLFVDHLVMVFQEVRRVLRKYGTIWVNLGDSWNGAGSTGDQFGNVDEDNKDNFSQGRSLKTIPKKSLIGIPFRFALKMIDNGFILRNTIIWQKPNQMPQSARDRFTNDFEYIFLFAKENKYYFKQQFDNGKIPKTFKYTGNTVKPTTDPLIQDPSEVKRQILQRKAKEFEKTGQITRNARCVWPINHASYKEAHFATFPLELLKRPLLAGCPDAVCSQCKTPKQLIYDTIPVQTRPGTDSKDVDGVFGNGPQRKMPMHIGTHYEQCNCNAPFIPGIVLDPFFGSGTTGLAALLQGKNFVGIDLNPDYIEMAKKRLDLYWHNTRLDSFLKIN